MTNQLFSRAAVFSDLHIGNKRNSQLFLDDCTDFITWFIQESKSRGCETCIFCGDFHHERSSINARSLNVSVSIMAQLSAAFEKVYVILGNHDLFYRESRSIYSFPYAERYENVEVVTEMTNTGNVLLVPWLVGDEWKKIKKQKSKYVFGHFELPHFMMNAIVEMPDHGELNADDFEVADYVFSGHFHKRQARGNVHYLGSPFAHNYSDAWDDERGAMFLDWDGVPTYVDYKGPRYIRINLSDLIDGPEQYLNSKTYCRAMLDVPISYEEANFIKETFMAQFEPRELSLMPAKREEFGQDISRDGDFIVESVDQIVYNQLNAVESEMVQQKLLMDIYKSL